MFLTPKSSAFNIFKPVHTHLQFMDIYKYTEVKVTAQRK